MQFNTFASTFLNATVFTKKVLAMRAMNCHAVSGGALKSGILFSLE